MTRRSVRLLGAAAAAALLAAPAAAQVPVTPRALGMGGAYIGVARGQEALWENPANLGLSGNPSWSFAFPQVVAGATVTGLTLHDLKDLGDYNSLDDQEKADLLGRIPAQGTGADVDVRIPVAALSFQHFAFGVSYNARVDHGIAKDIVDLFLNGVNTSRAAARNYAFAGTAGHRVSYVDIAAGHGRRVGPLSVGVTGHYYIGRSALSSSLDPSARYCTLPYPTACVSTTGVPQDVEVDYYGLESSGGHGYGVDVGAAIQPIPGLTLGAVVQNAIGSMSWDKDLSYRLITFSRQDYDNADFGDVMDRYDASKKAYSSGSAPAKVAALQGGLLAGADFSRVIRLGGAFDFPTGTTVGAQFSSRGDEGFRTQGIWKQSFSLGVQQKLPIVTLSGGFAKDDASGSLLSGGVALGPLKLGIGRLDNGSENGADRKGWVGTLALNINGPKMP
jgi:hypothetical protein